MNGHRPDKQHPDNPTTDELFYAALNSIDEDSAWTAISILQHQGSRTVFERASQLCASPLPHEQRVGADILGQLGIIALTFHEEIVAILLDMLEQEREPDVLKSIAIALGHRHDPRTIEPLVHLKNHPNEGVREGVTFGLLDHEDELAIQTLIELSHDPDAYYIRDWATFGLGTQVKVDTPTIREALVARLADEEGIVRGEAMIGLALRQDQRMLKPLHNDLSIGWLAITRTDEALRIRQCLYPALVKMSDAWPDDKNNEYYKQLEECIEKCKYDTI